MRSVKEFYLSGLFAIVCFFLTRQIPFQAYSILSNVAVALFILPTIVKYRDVLIASILLFPLLIYSLLIGNEILYAIRMYVILLALISAHYIKLPCNVWNILLFFSIIQCIAEIVCSLLLSFGILDPIVTLKFLREMEWGSVYPFSDIIPVYKVQVKGCGILTFVYMLLYFVDMPIKRSRILKGLFLASIIIAGNLAYLLSIMCFHIYYCFKSLTHKSTGKFILLFFCALIITPYIIDFIKWQLEKKSEESTPIRFEQVSVLLDDMQDNTATTILGTGIGHIVNKRGQYRDYVDSTYFELQNVYFYNQMGIFYFIILFVLYRLAKNHIVNNDLRKVYIFYVLYAATNPYMLDTTQFVVILTMGNLNRINEFRF